MIVSLDVLEEKKRREEKRKEKRKEKRREKRRKEERKERKGGVPSNILFGRWSYADHHRLQSM